MKISQHVEVGMKRLEKLATKLEKLPPKRFNYNSWVGRNWGKKPDLSCGTTACAMGWATTMPEFRRLGLRMNAAGTPVFSDQVKLDDVPDAQVCFGRSDVTYGGVGSAAEIFRISLESAGYLFVPGYQTKLGEAPDEYASAKAVARHIRNFVRRVRKGEVAP